MLPVRQAIERAQRFLLGRQDEDGLWRDYLLPPGPSTSWVTACVAHSLVGCELDGAVYQLAKAEQALVAQRRPQGWGYNESVACDADSTAAVLRFLAKQKNPAVSDALLLLSPYISDDGGVRTFEDKARFGRWAESHSDVAPAVGLALKECKVGDNFVASIRDWCIHQQQSDGSWPSFWWSNCNYSTSKNLEFLAMSGGVAECVASSVFNWLTLQSVLETTGDMASALSIASYVKPQGNQQGQQIAQDLCRTQRADGSWNASEILLVPNQWHAEELPLPYRDVRHTMSTAWAVEALLRLSII